MILKIILVLSIIFIIAMTRRYVKQYQVAKAKHEATLSLHQPPFRL